MDDSAVKLLAALVVAGLSALTFVAYKHPEPYKKMAAGVSVVSVALLLIGGTWQVAILTVQSAVELSDLIIAGKYSEIHRMIGDHYIPAWLLYSVVVCQLYAFFLTSLPYWLLDKAKPQNEDNKI